MLRLRIPGIIPLLVVVMLAIASCGGDEDNPIISTPTDEGAAEWWLVSTYRTINTVDDIWGNRPDNVYLAAGDNLLHYRDGRWRVLFEYPDDIEGQYSGFEAIWGYAEDSFVVVGYNNLIMHYKNGTIDTVQLGLSQSLLAVWGSSGDNIYAVGYHYMYGNCVIHFDGETWRDVTFEDELDFRGVWVSSQGIPYLAERTSGIWTLSDTGWTEYDAIPGDYWGMGGVTGRNPDELYVLGTSDTVWGYHGGVWTPEVVGADWMGLKCTNDSTILGYGYSPQTSVKIGGDWISLPDNEFYNPYFGMGGGWASGINDVWVGSGSGALHRFDGTSWASGWGDALTMSCLQDVYVIDPSNIFIGTHDGNVIRRTRGQWVSDFLGTSDSVSALWGSAAGNVYAVTTGGGIYNFDGSNWSIDYAVQYGTFHDIYGTGDGNVYAVGYHSQQERTLIAHWNGSAWTEIHDTLHVHANCIMEAENDDMYIFTDGGYLLYADGEWEFHDSSPTIRSACDIDGVIWGVSDASVFSFNGSVWSEQYTYENSLSGPKSVWRLGETLFVTGGRPRLLKYYNGQWTSVRGVDFSTLNSIHGTSSEDIWAVGQSGTILHYSR